MSRKPPSKECYQVFDQLAVKVTPAALALFGWRELPPCKPAEKVLCFYISNKIRTFKQQEFIKSIRLKNASGIRSMAIWKQDESLRWSAIGNHDFSNDMRAATKTLSEYSESWEQGSFVVTAVMSAEMQDASDDVVCVYDRCRCFCGDETHSARGFACLSFLRTSPLPFAKL